MAFDTGNTRRLTPQDLHNARQGVLRLRDAIGLDMRQKPRISEIFPGPRLEDMISGGRAAEAEAPLKAMLEENPLCKFAIYGLIRVYSHTGRIKQAEALLDYAVERELAGDGIFYAMAEGHIRNGMGASAALIIDMAGARGKLSACMCSRLLTHMERNGCDASVRTLFQKAQDTGIADERMFERAVGLMVRANDMDGASELFRTHRKEFGSVRSYTSMIKGFASVGEISRVAWYFDEAMNRNLVDARLVTSLIKAYDSADFPRLARSAYFKAMKLGISSDEMNRSMLGVYIARGQTRNAFEVLKFIEAKGEASPLNYFDVASLLYAEGETATACRLFAESCKAGCLNANGLEFIFSRLYGDSKYGCIVSLFESIPDRIRRDPTVILKAADALRKLGRYSEATALLEDMLLHRGVDMESRFRARAIIGFCLKDSGRKDESLRLFLELHRTVPGTFHCSDRISCGLIFCWDELKYDTRLRDEDVRAINRKLKAAVTSARNSLRQDIEHALEAIERSGVLDIPEYSFAVK
jgi:tetratricopeptide (TPR) repeat protein